LTAISDSNATINFTLDGLGRATSISNTIAGLTPTVALTQVFNAAGLRTEFKATIGSTLDFRNTAQYDSLGRVTEIIQQNQAGGNAVTAKRAAFEYNTLNQRTKLTRYQSTGSSNIVASTEYGYDTLNRLSSLTHKQNSTVLAGYTYGYDGVSRLTSVTSTIEGLSSYTYDAASQVTAADHAAGGQADETYGYDLNGNRNTSGYTVTTNNRTTAQPGFTYVYDDQGNRISRTETATGKVTEYSWDHRNRLTVVKDRNTSGGSVVKQVDYAYDAFNRLVKRTYDADGAGAGAATSQFWVYDEGINAVLQFDGSASTNLSHRYLWTGVVDELIADEIFGSGADTLYAIGDHLGTIRDIANYNESTSAATVTNHRTYNSFGKLTAETNAAVDLIFGYTGKQLDEATGLQHNLFRWYDSALGQWLSEDSLGFEAGDENLKRYVGNGVAMATDPLGLFQEPPVPGIGVYYGITSPPPTTTPPEVLPPLIRMSQQEFTLDRLLKIVEDAAKAQILDPAVKQLKDDHAEILESWKEMAEENKRWGIPLLLATSLATAPFLSDQIEKFEEYAGTKFEPNFSRSYSFSYGRATFSVYFNFKVKDISTLVEDMRRMSKTLFNWSGNHNYQMGVGGSLQFHY
jgi:RHS repeat-associated protein